MDTRGALKTGITMSQQIVESYLGDLSDADLLVRPVPGTNHIAWQLGHLIGSEHAMVDGIRKGSMPKLPEGFQEQHTKETAPIDDPSKFLTKAQYLEAFHAQRAGTLALVETMSDADLDQPAPEFIRHFVPTVGDVLSMQGSHWLMHAGQWAVIRRKLGKPPLF